MAIVLRLRSLLSLLIREKLDDRCMYHHLTSLQLRFIPISPVCTGAPRDACKTVLAILFVKGENKPTPENNPSGHQQ